MKLTPLYFFFFLVAKIESSRSDLGVSSGGGQNQRAKPRGQDRSFDAHPFSQGHWDMCGLTRYPRSLVSEICLFSVVVID